MNPEPDALNSSSKAIRKAAKKYRKVLRTNSKGVKKNKLQPRATAIEDALTGQDSMDAHGLTAGGSQPFHSPFRDLPVPSLLATL